MEKGLVFQKNDSEYVIALCAAKEKGNVAILLRRPNDCECLTVSNLQTDKHGKYVWERGYQARSYDDALLNFMSRISA